MLLVHHNKEAMDTNNKKADVTNRKREREESRDDVWHSFQDIPAGPQLPMHPMRRIDSRELKPPPTIYYETHVRYEQSISKVKESLLHAVRIGNLQFLDDLFSSDWGERLFHRNSWMVSPYRSYCPCLLLHGVEYSQKSTSLIVEACQYGQVDVMQKLIQDLKFDINTKDARGTALDMAVERGDQQAFDLLVNHPNIALHPNKDWVGQRISDRSRYRLRVPSPLCRAARFGRFEMVRTLLQKGAIEADVVVKPEGFNSGRDLFHEEGASNIATLSLYDAVYNAHHYSDHGSDSEPYATAPVNKERWLRILELLLMQKW